MSAVIKHTLSFPQTCTARSIKTPSLRKQSEVHAFFWSNFEQRMFKRICLEGSLQRQLINSAMRLHQQTLLLSSSCWCKDFFLYLEVIPFFRTFFFLCADVRLDHAQQGAFPHELHGDRGKPPAHRWAADPTQPLCDELYGKPSLLSLLSQTLAT